MSVYTAKPGIVIGKNGQAIEELKGEIQKMTSQKVAVNIEEPKQTLSWLLKNRTGFWKTV